MALASTRRSTSRREASENADLPRRQPRAHRVEHRGGPTGGPTDSGRTSPGGGGGGPSGAGDNGGGAAPAACAPQHSDAPGVSDTEIRLGNVSTISGPVPNFGATGRAGAKAYLDYVNSQGGVCGRKLSLVNGDDRLDPGINRSQTEQMKDTVLGFVGDTTVEDDGGAGVIGGTNIPNCSLVIGNSSITQPNFYSPNPIDPSVPRTAPPRSGPG